MMASTVKNGIDRLRNGNQQRRDAFLRASVELSSSERRDAFLRASVSFSNLHNFN